MLVRNVKLNTLFCVVYFEKSCCYLKHLHSVNRKTIENDFKQTIELIIKSEEPFVVFNGVIGVELFVPLENEQLVWKPFFVGVVKTTVKSRILHKRLAVHYQDVVVNKLDPLAAMTMNFNHHQNAAEKYLHNEENCVKMTREEAQEATTWFSNNPSLPLQMWIPQNNNAKFSTEKPVLHLHLDGKETVFYPQDPRYDEAEKILKQHHIKGSH